jgi:hypothetical protein
MSGTTRRQKELVARIAADSEVTKDEPMPVGAVFTRPNKSVTVSTRLAPTELAEIEALAEQLDVPVAALIRGWILAGLNARQGETVQGAIEGLSADLQRLRELVA